MGIIKNSKGFNNGPVNNYNKCKMLKREVRNVKNVFKFFVWIAIKG